jgi:hypothetical protein
MRTTCCAAIILLNFVVLIISGADNLHITFCWLQVTQLCRHSTYCLPLRVLCCEATTSIFASFAVNTDGVRKSHKSRRHLILLRSRNLIRSTSRVVHRQTSVSTYNIYQYNETNVTHFPFNLLRIKSLYMFRALLAHPQEVLHKRHMVYCVRVLRQLAAPGLGSTPILVQWSAPKGTDHCSSEEYRYTHVDACVARTWISYRCVPCHPWCTHRTALVVKRNFFSFPAAVNNSIKVGPLVFLL